MKVSRFYISQILEEVCSLFSDVSKNVSAGNRKSASQKQMQDFIVVSLPVNVPDSNVMQDTTIRFDLAARNIQNGLENTSKLQKMLDSVISYFPIKSGSGRFSVTDPVVVLKGDDGLGFSHWLINAELRINQTDSYKY